MDSEDGETLGEYEELIASDEALDEALGGAGFANDEDMQTQLIAANGDVDEEEEIRANFDLPSRVSSTPKRKQPIERDSSSGEKTKNIRHNPRSGSFAILQQMAASADKDAQQAANEVRVAELRYQAEQERLQFERQEREEERRMRREEMKQAREEARDFNRLLLMALLGKNPEAR